MPKPQKLCTIWCRMTLFHWCYFSITFSWSTKLFELINKDENKIDLKWKFLINPFSTNVPLLYPLKTSKNRRFSVFRGYTNGTLVENELNATLVKTYLEEKIYFIKVSILTNKTWNWSHDRNNTRTFHLINYWIHFLL